MFCIMLICMRFLKSIEFRMNTFRKPCGRMSSLNCNICIAVFKIIGTILNILSSLFPFSLFNYECRSEVGITHVCVAFNPKFLTFIFFTLNEINLTHSLGEEKMICFTGFVERVFFCVNYRSIISYFEHLNYSQFYEQPTSLLHCRPNAGKSKKYRTILCNFWVTANSTWLLDYRQGKCLCTRPTSGVAYERYYDSITKTIWFWRVFDTTSAVSRIVLLVISHFCQKLFHYICIIKNFQNWANMRLKLI